MAEPINPQEQREFNRPRLERLHLIPLDADPADAQNGDIWYNGTTDKFRKREADTNKDLDAA